MLAPYGVPKAVIFANVIKLPEESIEAMFVAPYLKNSLPPDSTIEKFVVASVVAAAAVVALPAVRPAAVPVMFVPTKADGVPRAGVISVGLVANTAEPVPVSSVSAVNS
jgi:hypothetical protein